ncbi:Glycoside hydrolase family 32 [Macrophomina phaseolina MS6]|uniref:Glycoside hydrolase family 32 n=1 Tax=Macrophomina phaseolina (strain MS6) TaxID=1126212 RepID=K2RW46_MACPH|nr:Glycoside hydrolase family 32 [Macrophomina phaseolina MS6]
MNDPCAPGYDPATRQYHVGFQWNPNGAEWGDIVWGNSTSSDLVNWKVAPKPTVSRDTAYDHAGVFTGCFRPTAPNGAQDGTLTYIYTAVSKLPIHYTLPYNIGSEKLAIATSKDGGKTWSKPAANPILEGPPKDVPVTGWRDPYVAPWAAMGSALAGKYADGKLFATISGGLIGKTPTVFLYAVDECDLTKWEYLGPLIDVGLNKCPSHWSGDLGVNWEVTNFMTLADGEGASQEFLILGAEGCKSVYRQEGSKRTPRGQLWVAAQIKKLENRTTADSLMDHSYGGVFDHGLFYAANGFWDPETQQQTVIGWVVEDDLPVHLQIKQRWSGCLSLPRVASLLTLRNVVKARTSDLAAITSIQAEPDANGTSTVRTLRISPDRRLQQLRRPAKQTALPATSLGPLNGAIHVPLKTSRWEFNGEFSVAQTCSRVGLAIYHSEGMPPRRIAPSAPFSSRETNVRTDLQSHTKLYWSPAEEDFAVERPDLITADSSVKMQAEHAPHTLFTTRDASTGQESEERLRIRAFYDGSVLEIFVNERTAVTTRIYTPDARCVGLAAFAEAEGDAQQSAAITECSIWDGLACA